MAHRRGHRGRHQVWRESVGGAVRAAAYHADAVHFDDVTYLSIASLTAPTSGDFALSYWFKTAGNQPDFTTTFISDPSSNAVPAMYYVSNALLIDLFSGDTARHLKASTAALTNNAWHHLLCGAKTDLSAGNKQIKLYVDRVDVTSGIVDVDGTFTSTFDSFLFAVFGDTFGSNFEGDIADFWFAPGHSILTAGDIAESTLNKFITAGNKPVNLGTDGSTPTGTAPAVFFSGGSASFGTNKGTGGAFTTSGTITNASTSPSD